MENCRKFIDFERFLRQSKQWYILFILLIKKVNLMPNTNTDADAVEVKKPVVKRTPKAISKKPEAAKPAAAKPSAAKPVAEKPAAKPAKAPAPARAVAKPVSKPVAPPKEKVKKAKLVRDSFSMPEAEYAVLGAVKKACLKAGIEVKKSELLRIGVALIQKMDVAALKGVLAGLPPLKAGRPKQDK
jgi:hypothetical protein